MGTGRGARRGTKILPLPTPTTQPHAAARSGRPLPGLSAPAPLRHGSSAPHGDSGSSPAATGRQPAEQRPPLRHLALAARRPGTGESNAEPLGATPSSRPGRRPGAGGHPSRRTGPGRHRPPAPRAEPAGTWSPGRGGWRGARGGAHYKSQCALRGGPSPRRRGDVVGEGEGVQPCLLPWRPARGPGAVKTTLPVVPRAAGGMEGRVAERLRGALGPLGFEVHAFKVLASRAVTSPASDVRRSDVTVPRGGRERGTAAVPATGGRPCGGGGGERCRPECSRARPALCFPRLGRAGSGRGEAARPPGSRLPPAQTGRAPVLRSGPTAGGTASPGGGCSALRSASPRRPSSGMKPPGCERLRGRRRPPPPPAGRQAPLRRGRRAGRPLPRGSGELPSAHRGPGAAVRGLAALLRSRPARLLARVGEQA